jgi:prolyl-tRNA synthetase
VARRDTKEKKTMAMEGLAQQILILLEEIQVNIFDRAHQFRKDHITKADNWDDFVKLLDEKGGFIAAHWDGTPETEDKIKEQTKATIRCVPLHNEQEDGACILTGKPSRERVLFARAY